jgi:hypothetical protein
MERQAKLNGTAVDSSRDRPGDDTEARDDG